MMSALMFDRVGKKKVLGGCLFIVSALVVILMLGPSWSHAFLLALMS
jgi:hypothetical protein